jgi:uncharacterized Fe-S radical SAM superfamily protein PflX
MRPYTETLPTHHLSPWKRSCFVCLFVQILELVANAHAGRITLDELASLAAHVDAGGETSVNLTGASDAYIPSRMV